MRASRRRSSAVARAWRQTESWRRLTAQLSGLDDATAQTVGRRVRALLEDTGWTEELVAPLIEALASDPWFEPPFPISRDPLRTGLVLVDCPAVAITASVLSADALAQLPPPATIVVPGRLSVVRYLRGGGARMRLWSAECVGDDFSAADAVSCRALGALPLGDGVVLSIDGRVRGHLLEAATSDVVTLTATIRAGAAPFMREYRISDGSFLRAATIDDGAARSQMLLTALRQLGRADAGPAFAAASRDRAFFLRWHAMREWLATDARGALPRLREMAAGDPNAEVRAAAAAMLPVVERGIAERRCHG